MHSSTITDSLLPRQNSQPLTSSSLGMPCVVSGDQGTGWNSCCVNLSFVPAGSPDAAATSPQNSGAESDQVSRSWETVSRRTEPSWVSMPRMAADGGRGKRRRRECVLRATWCAAAAARDAAAAQGLLLLLLLGDENALGGCRDDLCRLLAAEWAVLPAESSISGAFRVLVVRWRALYQRCVG
jgi:hypothetical protein